MKILDSLFILRKYSESIPVLVDLLNDHHWNKDTPTNTWTDKELQLYTALISQILLNTDSFLEEFNGHFLNNVEQEYKVRVKNVHEIAAPAIRRIRKWSGLKKFRNNVLAHNFRVDKNEMALSYMWKYNIPRTTNDIFLLERCMATILAVIISQFPEFDVKIEEHVEQIKKKHYQPPVTPTNYKKELENILLEVLYNGKTRGSAHLINVPTILNRREFSDQTAI